jgi:hypothetical protein
MLKKLIKSPYLNLLSGVILLLASGYETFARFNELTLASHHGILFFSLVQILKAIPEVMHGLKEIDQSRASTKEFSS